MEYSQNNRVVFIRARLCSRSFVEEARCLTFGETCITNIVQGSPSGVTLGSWRSSIVVVNLGNRVVEISIVILDHILSGSFLRLVAFNGFTELHSLYICWNISFLVCSFENWVALMTRRKRLKAMDATNANLSNGFGFSRKVRNSVFFSRRASFVSERSSPSTAR